MAAISSTARSRISLTRTAEWLEALRRTYGYEPIAFTTCPPDTDLRNAAVFCRVKSWLTGRRLVSLPFSDHCDLLADTGGDLIAIVTIFCRELRKENLRYIEARPLHAPGTSILKPDSTYDYCFHHIDLRPDLDMVFRSFHKNSIQRKIHRAEQECLTYEEGRSESLLNKFYHLLLLTYRRRIVLPQPKRWFQELDRVFWRSTKDSSCIQRRATYRIDPYIALQRYSGL